MVFGSGHPFFATGPLPRPILFENPAQGVLGDRVPHLSCTTSRRVDAVSERSRAGLVRSQAASLSG